MLENNSVFFIDSQVPNPNQLINGLDPNTNIHYLNSGQEGLAQISRVLEQYQNLDAIHIVSHGSEGSLQLGSSILSLETLDQYRQDLAGWSNALKEDADILFFGCNVAHGERGQAFIQQLDTLTGADIGASTDLTGHVRLGGDWTLEAATGTIEAQNPFAADSLTNYQGTLASLTDSLSGAQDLDDDVTVTGDTIPGNNDSTLTDSLAPDLSDREIRDNSDRASPIMVWKAGLRLPIRAEQGGQAVSMSRKSRGMATAFFRRSMG